MKDTLLENFILCGAVEQTFCGGFSWVTVITVILTKYVSGGSLIQGLHYLIVSKVLVWCLNSLK